MADVHDIETRSYNMSRIRGKDTKPEMIVRKYLHSNGFRYRLHDKKLPGNPDLILKKYNAVIFIHGCFWHGHQGCKYFKIPETRTEWWKNKIEATRQRALYNEELLKKQGWRVLIVWECSLKKNAAESTLRSLLDSLSAV